MAKILKYFGTDGFRGRVGDTLTELHAYKIGKCLPRLLMGEGRPRFVIGRDTRLSSAMLEAALTAGLTASGADVYSIGTVTTPGLAFICKSGFDGGVMITASHNPYLDNGIKIFDRSGEKLDARFEAVIEEYIDGEKELPPCGRAEEIGRVIESSGLIDEYKTFLLSNFSEGNVRLRVGIDAANGAAYKIAKEVFEATGAEVYAIGISPSGMNVNEGCGSTHPEALSELVKELSLDVAFAFDGDGDRCIAVDEGGKVIDGDRASYALAVDMKKRGVLCGDKIAVTVMSGGALESALAEHGIGVLRTDVGDKYVAAAIKREGLSFGAESSGHMIFADILNTGDGILSALMLTSLMIRGDISSSEIGKGYTALPMVNESVRCEGASAVMNSPSFSLECERAKKLLGENSRLIVRKSGTEPKIRISAEGKRGDVCVAAVKLIAEYIKKFNTGID